MSDHLFPRILKDWKAADHERAQEVLWKLHSLIERPNIFSLDDARALSDELKQIGDAFAEQRHWDRYGCTIGCYTG